MAAKSGHLPPSDAARTDLAGQSENQRSAESSLRLDISRNTVRRYIRSEAAEPSYSSRQSASSLDEYAPKLSAWLVSVSAKSRKQCRTLKQMFLDLRTLGYEGSYDRVPAFGREWKVGQMERVKSASKSTDATLSLSQKVVPNLISSHLYKIGLSTYALFRTLGLSFLERHTKLPRK